MNSLSSHLSGKCRIFDPLTRQCYEDLSPLDTSQVILYGEVHETEVLAKAQEEILDIVHRTNSTGTTCLLLEGLAIGQSMKAEDFLRYSVDKSVVILGADCRAEPWKEIHKKIYLWNKQRHELIKLKRQKSLEHVQKMASILNKELLHNRIQFTKDELIVRQAIAEEIFGLEEKIIGPVTCLLKKHEDKAENFPASDEGSAQLEKSNVHFAEQVVEASKKYSRIFGVMGQAHFFLNNSILARLRSEKIKFSVIFPTTKQQELAEHEGNWPLNEYDRVKLRMLDGVALTTIVIPKEFSHLLHPAIRKTLSGVSSVKPLELDDAFFKEIHQRKISVLEFTQPLKLKMPPFRAVNLDAFADNNQRDQFNSEILLTLRDYFFFKGLRFIDIKGASKVERCSNEKEHTLTLHSEESITVQLAHDFLITEAQVLFDELAHRGQPEIRIPADKKVALLDVKGDQLTKLMSDCQLDHCLSAFAPKGYSIKTTGHINISPSADDIPVLVLSNKNGLAFTLTHKVEP